VKKKVNVRILSILCVIAVCLSLIPVVGAYTGVSEWAEESIAAMEELGLVPERMADNDLRLPITREEMCYVVMAAYEKYMGEVDAPEEPEPFTDTQDEVVAKAYGLGLVSGYPDGTFQPDAALTRQEFFNLCHRALLAFGWIPAQEDFSDLEEFVDKAQIADWALESTQAMVGIGVVYGKSDNTIVPRQDTTSEEALALFYRTYTYMMQWDVDVKDSFENVSDWAAENVAEMMRLALVPSTLLGTDLTASISRGDMCRMALLAYKKVKDDDLSYMEIPESPFSDTEDPDIILGYYMGLISGFPDGTFRPEDSITREQIFAITVNFLRALDYPFDDNRLIDLDSYPDGAAINEYARPATRLLLSLGILQGSTSGELMPRSETSRQEAMSFFLRAYHYMVKYLDDLYQDFQPEVPSEAQALVDFALNYVGYPYTWGGVSPETGFDCTGLVYYVYKQFGYTLHRTHQWEDGVEVPITDLQLGDIMIFSSTGSMDNITHVGLYIGDDLFLHAANTNRGVVVDSVFSSYCQNGLVSARRIIFE
jgi:hypothetical protein